MNLSKFDILATAEQYLRQYGVDAADYARRCAAAMLIATDVEAWETWNQVIREIEELQRQRYAVGAVN